MDNLSFIPKGRIPLPQTIMVLLLNLFILFFPISAMPATPPAAAPITADDLIYYTENYPPHNYLENNRLTGISIELMELIWEKLGAVKTREDITLLPWARAVKQLETRPNTVLFGMGFTLERAKKFHLVGPYYTHALSLICPMDTLVDITTLDQAKPFRIGVVRQDMAHHYLVDQGFDETSLDLCMDIEQLHQKFIHGRFDMICYGRDTYFNYLAAQKETTGNFKEVLTITMMKSGFGFNRNIPRTLIQDFQKALDELKAEGKVLQILKSYGLN